MKIRLFLFALAIYLGGIGAIIAAPPKTIRIYNSPGGVITEFMQYFQARYYRRIVVDGKCASACTLVLDLPHMCATPNARFGFHQAYRVIKPGPHMPGVVVPAPEGTNIMMKHYPPAVKMWIDRKGGLPFGDPIWLEGPDMQWIVPQCRR